MRLYCGDDGVELLIQDDGRGFDPSHKSHQRFGLQIMSERACEAGIALEISTQIGRGTTLKALWLKKDDQ